jgi:hypothetical protein
MICGSALETTVLLRVETKSARSRPLSTFSTCRRDAGDVAGEIDSFTMLL